MTTEGVLNIFKDRQLHDYIVDFTKSNLAPDRQESFLKDVWCDIGMLGQDDPSLHCIAEVVWRRMIQYEPILKRLADGYTQDELAEEIGKNQSNICRKVQKLAHKNSPPGPV